MFFSRIGKFQNKDMQISTKVQMSKAPKIVFVIRLSAIGDTIIAAHAVNELCAAGFTPIFVTYPESRDLALHMRNLKYWIEYTKNRMLSLYKISSRSDTEPGSMDFCAWNEVAEPLRGIKIPILDLQNTARSRKAIRDLTKIFLPNQTVVFKVNKRTFYRNWLIVKSFFGDKKRKPNQSKYTPPANIVRIKDLNSLLIKQFIAQQHAEYNISKPTDNIFYKPEIPPELALEARSYIVIFPGASGPLKAWPKESFKALVELLLANTNLSIVIIGGKSEGEIGRYLQNSTSERVRNFCGETPLARSISLLANAKYVVTGDSFPAHICDAFGIPATVIFGGTSPLFGFLPSSSSVSTRYLQLPCSPCTRHGKSTCRRRDLWCLKGILAEDIFKDVVSGG